VEVAGNDGFGRANNRASWGQTYFGSMGTEVAFLRGARVAVDIQRIIRTALHASFAADANAVVDIDNSVGAFFQRVDRANGHAGSVRALVAAEYRKIATNFRKTPCLGVLHPSPEITDRNVVFGFAGYGAGVAADAAGLVDDKAELQDFAPKPREKITFLILSNSRKCGKKVCNSGLE
jgi:hypothetical protein